MNRSLPTWLHLRRGKRSPIYRGTYAQGPEAALFHGLRIRLTLWYCLVLGLALVLFCVILYFGVQYFLLTPVEDDATAHAYAHVGQWLRISPDRACSQYGPQGGLGPPPPSQGIFMSELVACYDQNGSLKQNANTEDYPSAFLNNNLAKMALRKGQPVSDTVDGGGTNGQIYRFALTVPNPAGNGNVGVVMIGESIQNQENALSLLLTLMLIVGGVALIGAGLGGLFLANRALEPARLAWARQQRFIADAAHELRTPLTLLRADAEVLLRSREQLVPEDAMLLEDIVAEASHMGRLSSNLLTLARLDNRSAHQEQEVVNLTDVASAAVRRIQALADQAEISLQVESSDIAVVIGDPMLLEQAVLALLDNAIKYNRRGGHVLVQTSAKQEQALIEVSDTGIGIAAEHLPHLGERFYRVDKARSREAGGTGLGLSIARSIASAHGGTLTLTSVPEQGTTVMMRLPLAQGILSHNDR
jgi:signal transduction histidine kinase